MTDTRQPTPIRDLTEAVRRRVTDVPEHWAPIQVRAHRNRAARRIHVAWYGAPREEEVLPRLADLLVGEDATVCLDRTRMWACGSFHADEEAAWIAHEGQEHLVFQCGCGAIEAEGDECDDSRLDPDDTPRYCAHLGSSVLSRAKRSELEMAGTVFVSGCQPGEYAICPVCRGHGSLLAPDHRSFYVCPGCDRDTVFDLDDPAEQVRYAAALATDAELTTERQAQAADSRTESRRRTLP